jgi:hypothetical protein
MCKTLSFFPSTKEKQKQGKYYLQRIKMVQSCCISQDGMELTILLPQVLGLQVCITLTWHCDKAPRKSFTTLRLNEAKKQVPPGPRIRLAAG